MSDKKFIKYEDIDKLPDKKTFIPLIKQTPKMYGGIDISIDNYIKIKKRTNDK